MPIFNKNLKQVSKKILYIITALYLISAFQFLIQTPLSNAQIQDEGWIDGHTKYSYLGNNIHKLEIYPKDTVYYDDISGTWIDINTTIIDIDQNQYGVENGRFKAYFNKNLSDTWHIKVIIDNFEFTSRFRSMGYFDTSQDKYEKLKNLKTSANIVLSENTITYENIYANSDIRIVYTPNSLKEYLILNSTDISNLPNPNSMGLSRANTYVAGSQKITYELLDIYDDDIKKTENFTSNTISFKDFKQLIKYFLPISKAYENETDNFQDILFRIGYKNDKTFVQYGILYDWIITTSNHVIIDPTVTIQPDDGLDTVIDDNSPTSNLGAVTWINIGDQIGTNNSRRGLIRFDLSSIPSNAIVINSFVELYENVVGESGSPPANCNISFNRVLRNWVELEATWNKWESGGGGDWTLAGASDTNNDINGTVSASLLLDNVAESDYVNFTGTRFISDVQGMINGTLNSYGWRIYTPNCEYLDGTSTRYHSFHSSDFGGSSTDPKLTILYFLPAYVTLYSHEGINQLILNGSVVSNGTETLMFVTNTVNITITVFNGYSFDRYRFDNGTLASLVNPYYQYLGGNITIHAYASTILTTTTTYSHTTTRTIAVSTLNLGEPDITFIRFIYIALILFTFVLLFEMYELMSKLGKRVGLVKA